MAAMALPMDCSIHGLWNILVESLGRLAWIVAAAAMVLVHRRSRKITVGVSYEVSLKFPPGIQEQGKKEEEATVDPFAAGRDFVDFREDFDRLAKESPPWSVLEKLAEGNFVCKGVGFDREEDDPSTSSKDSDSRWEEEEDQRDLGISWRFQVPRWANSLIQPLMPGQEWLDYAKNFAAGVDDPRPRTLVARGPRYLRDEVVKLWGSSKQRILDNLYLPPGQGFATALGIGQQCCSIDGAVAAGSSRGFVNLWDVSTGDCVRSFQASPSASASSLPSLSIEAVAMGGGGGIYCSSGGVIGLWDDRDMKKEVECFEFVDSLAAGIEIEWIGHEFVVRRQDGREVAFDGRMAARSCTGLPLPAEAAEEAEEAAAAAAEEEEVWWDAIDDEWQWVEEEEEEESDSDEEVEAHTASSSNFFSRFFKK